MTATTLLGPLIGKLTQKTEAKELNWSAIENGVELEMSDLIVRVAKRREGSQDEFVLELLTEDGVLIDSLPEANNGAAENRPVSRLYGLAYDRIRAAAIERLSTALDKPFQPDQAPKFVLPSGPTEEDQIAVFQAIQGLWLLDYSRGQEYARIYESGEYSIYDSVRKRNSPKFHLRLIAINRTGKKIELAKDALDGKRLQIEVLELDDMDRPLRMVGEAKHDRHRLAYTRM